MGAGMAKSAGLDRVLRRVGNRSCLPQTKSGGGIAGVSAKSRRGVATLDYVLVLGVVLPLAGFVLWAGPRIMNLVYEMLSVLVSWPFL